MKVALMARVSTEEQARHGFSIDTQLDNLRAWAKENGHMIVGEYVDAGVSGKKPYTKRPALSRFMSDLESGLQVDALVFTKLDRFFRSVKLYYQAVDVMTKYGVAWQAIQEDYETVTAAGRFKVNIMLAVAEDEADRTGERIRVVNEGKIARGEAVTGSVPIGYKICNKKVVPDEATAGIARDMFRHYLETGSIRGTMAYMRTEHNVIRSPKVLKGLLKNRLYIGQYRDNPEYCEPLIDEETFDAVQRQVQKREVRHNQTGRVYIFAGLLVCKECGRKMVSSHTHISGKDYYSYRCPGHLNSLCPHGKTASEEKLERWLLLHIEDAITDAETAYSYQSRQQAAVPKVDKSAIMKKLERLKDLYVDGLITKEQYRTDYEKYTKALNVPETPAINYRKIREIIGKQFTERYNALPRDQKRVLWHLILAHAVIGNDGQIELFFRA